MDLLRRGYVGGSPPPNPRPEGFPLWTPLGDVTSWAEKTIYAWSVGVTEVSRLLAQGKPGKSLGESELSPRDFPDFPRMRSIRVGGFLPQAQSSQVRTADIARFA